MKKLAIMTMFLALTLTTASQGAIVAEITHTEFQSVLAGGEQTYNASEKVILKGILLHNPADMLDPTPDDAQGQARCLWGQEGLKKHGRGKITTHIFNRISRII